MPILDESGDAIREGSRFPCARPRKYQGRSLRMHHRLELGGIQQAGIIDAIALARTRRFGSGEDELFHEDCNCLVG